MKKIYNYMYFKKGREKEETKTKGNDSFQKKNKELL